MRQKETSPHISERHPLGSIKARYFFIILITVSLPFGFAIHLTPETNIAIIESVLSHLFYLVPFLWLVWLLRRRGTSLFYIMNHASFSIKKNWGFLTILVFTLLAISTAGLFVIYYPCSFFFEEWIEETFLISEKEFIFPTAEGGSWAIYSSSFLSGVILAPLVEEIFFRGVLLHRWSEKWGLRKAVFISSSIFAILHFDPLGSFYFGLVMAYLYVRFGTLWVPIFCHALNNLIAFIAASMGETFYDIPTLSEFQKDLMITGIPCLIFSLMIIPWFSKKYLLSKPWQMPRM